MIIKRISLTDFGGHKKIDFECPVNVVGLMGINGSGKSTILDAVQFAITGETRDPQATYIRQGAEKAIVELVFSKNGQEGTITRQIGKTNKRTLEWDNTKFTKVSEVDQRMSEILGVDKKALSSAVFVSQGDLQNILFGTDAEREELFIRLVNLAFCDTRGKMIEGKIKRLNSTVADLGALRDQAYGSLQTAKRSLIEADTLLTKMPDYAKSIENLAAVTNLEKQLAELHTQFEPAYRLVNERKAAVAEFFKANEIESKESLAERINLLGQTCTATSARVDQIHLQMGRLKQYNEKLGAVTRQQAELDRVAKEGKVLADSFSGDIDARLKVLHEQAEGIRSYKNALSSVNALEEKLKIETSKPAPQDPKLEVSIADKAKEIESISVLVQQNETWVNNHRKLSQCVANKMGEDSRCRDCGLFLNPDQQVDPAKLAELEKALEDLRQRLVKLRDMHRTETNLQQAFVTAQQTWQTTINTLTNQLDEAKAKWEALKPFAGFNLAEIEEEQTKLRALAKDLASARLNYRRVKETLDALKAELTPFEDCASKVGNPEFTEQTLIEACRQRDAVAAEHGRIKGLQSNLGVMEVELKNAVEQHKKLEDLIDSRNDLLEHCILGELAEAMLKQYNDHAELALAEMHNQQESRNQQQGVVREADRVLKEAQKAVDELEARIAQDQKKLECVSNLGRIKDLFQRQGIPGQYVRYRFGQLVQLTQHHLAKLNANFTVTADKNATLAFTFCRTDSGVSLPMSKLSGGQRVRLCLAFLMAVQTALVPDVGLLVLDEPSMHLDEEGVQSLAELLADTGRRLGNTDNQVWISDHAKDIAPALGAVLQLGSKTLPDSVEA